MDWLYWKTRVESFVTSVFPEMEAVLEWAEEQDVEITTPAILAAFGNINPTHQEVRDIEDINAQLHAILQTLCEKEPFQVVRSAGKSLGKEKALEKAKPLALERARGRKAKKNSWQSWTRNKKMRNQKRIPCLKL